MQRAQGYCALFYSPVVKISCSDETDRHSRFSISKNRTLLVVEVPVPIGCFSTGIEERTVVPTAVLRVPSNFLKAN